MDELTMHMFLDSSSSSSDDEEELLVLAEIEEEHLETERQCRPRRGSIQGHKCYQRDRIEGYNRLYQDYFAESPVYPPNLFRRRFSMRRSLFLHILNAVEVHEPYFVKKRNAAKTLGLSALQKVTAAIRMLSYGVAADYVDEYIIIGETTTIECLKKIVKAVVKNLSEEYLRSPNHNDIARLLEEGESRGFPGMLGSIDCMHWKWKNCLLAWKGMYVGHVQEPTIILEAVASYDLWIWHAFFGLPGSHNDINELEHSTVFQALGQGNATPVNYSISDHDYTMGYYLADVIYPPRSTFVKTISYPQDLKQQFFAKAQESARKDVERAFGVLQSCFAIVSGPARFWHNETLKNIMKACIIIHNMIVEDEGHAKIPDLNYEADENLQTMPSHEQTIEFMQFIQNHHSI